MVWDQLDINNINNSSIIINVGTRIEYDTNYEFKVFVMQYLQTFFFSIK